MSPNYAGKSHDEAVAARKTEKQRAQEQPGGEMAVDGTEADAAHSSGELSERAARKCGAAVAAWMAAGRFSRR